MKGYEITLEANSFDGSQVFACYAIDEQDAMMKLKRGECEIIESNIEVLGLDKVPIDIMESDDISSRLLSDINVKQQELIAKQAAEIEQLKYERNSATMREQAKNLVKMKEMDGQIKMLREALLIIVKIADFPPVDRAILKEANKALSATEQK